MERKSNFNARRGSKTKNNFKVPVIILSVVFVACFAVGFIFLNQGKKTDKEGGNAAAVFSTDEDENGKIAKNIFIDNIDVSDLTKEEAREKLAKDYKASSSPEKIVVMGAESPLEITPEDLKVGYDFNKEVDAAYKYTRDENNKAKKDVIKALEESPYKIKGEPVYSFDASALEEKITNLAQQIDIEPVNAVLERKDGKFIFTEEKNGMKLNVEETINKAKALAEEQKGGTIEAVMEEIPAKYKVADLEKATTLIGTGTSKYTGALTLPRNINIQNAASKINDYVVYPGEIFSTNKAFGVMDSANGYTLAPVITGGVLVDGIGGGVCQISSTLYNALLYSELEITERLNHSLKVGYMDYAFDATLAGDYIDLKFKNNTDYPVYVECYLEGNSVVANIYGYEVHEPGRTLSFSNSLVATVPPEDPEVIEDAKLAAGEKVEERAAKTGYRYELYKTVHQDGKKVETVKINNSYYKPVRAKLRVGVGTSLETPEETPKEETTELPEENNSSTTPDLNGTPATQETAPPPTVPTEKPAVPELPAQDPEEYYPTVIPPDLVPEGSNEGPVMPDL